MNRGTMMVAAALAVAAWTGLEAQENGRRSQQGMQGQQGMQQTGQPTQLQQQVSVVTQPVLLEGKEVTWMEGPNSLPQGARMALLEGDPMVAGKAFTIRFRMPRGYRIPPHWHSADEHVTVISGELALGDGDAFDASKLKRLTQGAFGALPAGHRHFAEARRETVLQLHGIGPWSITYVNPADDPRGVTKGR